MADIEQERDIVRRRLLGWDIASAPVLPGLDVGRDIVLSAGPAVDTATVSGLDNLNQALTHALTTRLGDDVFNTGYGFDGLNAIAEETDPIITRERIRISVITTLKRDARIRRIVDVQLGDRATDMPTSTADRHLDVRVAFEAVSGDAAAVDLLKGAIPSA